MSSESTQPNEAPRVFKTYTVQHNPVVRGKLAIAPRTKPLVTAVPTSTDKPAHK